ncbi:hypothetical protein VTJ49DRAFT_6815 [Mycothermus thermophilus]|uniref:LysM domain-containing protein n=1 Tax=Humicola insolens TaxID=85995 RepID=A0ABR3V0S7_HUMIN
MMILSACRSAFVAGLAAVSWCQEAAAIQLWATPGDIPTSVPARCRAALVQNITCPSSLVTAPQVASGSALSDDDAVAYCTDTCYDSLKTFQSRVATGCGTEIFVWAYDVSCIKDSTGFCLSSLYAGLKEVCSECSLKYGAAMLGSDYGRQRISPDDFSSLLSSCSADPTSYTYTYTSTPVTTTSTSTTAEPSPTCEGETYTVKAGDTCPSISKDKGVGTDLMISRNNLDYNCTTLSPGMSLCLQDICTIKTLDRNYTCSELTRGQPFGLIQLLSWNPSIHRNCDNMDSMIGRSICLSPPGGGTYDVNVTTGHPPNPTLDNPLVSSWVSADPTDPTTTDIDFTTSWYTPTLNRSATPSVIITMTFNETRASELAQQTQYCWLSDDDFANGFMEEDFPAGCQSLFDVYCFPTAGAPVPTEPARIPAVCTPDRATYTTDEPPSTTDVPQTTPVPYQPNMVEGCREFYKVFVEWNPDVGGDCRMLLLNYYVCVDA